MFYTIFVASSFERNILYFYADGTECIDKDEQFCASYVANYGDRFCDQEWFISSTGRYGCKLSCNRCDEVSEEETTTAMPTTEACEDGNTFCESYVRINEDFCNKDWFIGGKYQCKKSCNLC